VSRAGLDSPRGLSRTLTVTLRYQGVAVPLPSEPDLVLRAADLLLLQGLARGDGRPVAALVAEIATRGDVAADSLWRLLESLQRHGLLTAAAPPHAPLGGGRERAGAPAPLSNRAAAAPEPVAIATPLVLRPGPAGFDCIDHDGALVVRLDAVELAAASVLALAQPVAAGLAAHRAAAGPLALDAPRFAALVARLTDAGLVAPAAQADKGREDRFIQHAVAHQMRYTAAIDRHLTARPARPSPARVKVVPFDVRSEPMPLALGMLIAAAQAHRGGALLDHYEFCPQTIDPAQQRRVLADGPAVLLFSNYIWSHHENLRVSRDAKQRSPGSVTVHGGPDTPKYAQDVEAYFRANPHVDVAVHGEAEDTMAELLAALAGGIGAAAPELARLHVVPGLSVRHGDGVVRTAERARIADLDALPSPFLTGVFDAYLPAAPGSAIIETNRGCPYGCTFCDWGSATLSRIRKFSLERVFAELEWCAQRQITRVMLADANFGIFERDVEIARKVIALNRRYGYPKLFVTNYAKNNTKNLRPIVQELIDAGILTEGLLSLQSMDAETLRTVNRSNIKVQRYDELAREFRRAHLPLFIDLMLGLPGSTTASFRADLQGAVDREVTAKVFQTELLVNSPMNDPAYRAAHRIETSAPLHALVPPPADDAAAPPRAFVVASASFTRAEYGEMLGLRRVFLLCEHFGVLRQVSRFVRQRTGLAEIDFYATLCADANAARERWPAIAVAFALTPDLGVPPVSWRFFIDEIGAYLGERLGVAADGALRTVLAVQHALLPARQRTLPLTLALEHDFAAWHAAIVAVKDEGAADWTARVPDLATFAPARFAVADPRQVCTHGVGYGINETFHADWELESAVSRALPGEHVVM